MLRSADSRYAPRARLLSARWLVLPLGNGKETALTVTNPKDSNPKASGLLLSGTAVTSAKGMIVSNRYTRDDPDPCKGERSSPGLDERLTAEIKGLTARVADQKFTNRGILIALVVAILGGAAKIFGFLPNP